MCTLLCVLVAASVLACLPYTCPYITNWAAFVPQHFKQGCEAVFSSTTRDNGLVASQGREAFSLWEQLVKEEPMLRDTLLCHKTVEALERALPESVQSQACSLLILHQSPSYGGHWVKYCGQIMEWHSA
ncbi:hypothetical protein DFH07DRAFT_778884 [Mycena maculata]|uniref:Uncharacterized protein n=1 Tax=Mycena maculata TaxID=230809 RepID=A0AAD7MZ52_9AGAR|nr:hypothetical protein DFH07DRAFT_778884 [Mycena maculata]